MAVSAGYVLTVVGVAVVYLSPTQVASSSSPTAAQTSGGLWNRHSSRAMTPGHDNSNSQNNSLPLPADPLDALLASLTPYDPTGTPEKRAALCPYQNNQVYTPPSYAPPTNAPPSYAPPSFAPPSYAPPSYAPLSYAPPGYIPPRQYYPPGYNCYDNCAPPPAPCLCNPVIPGGGPAGPPGPPGPSGIPAQCPTTGWGPPGPPGPPGGGCPGAQGTPGRSAVCRCNGGGGCDPTVIVRMAIDIITRQGGCCSGTPMCDGDMTVLINQVVIVQNKIDQILKLDNQVDLLVSAVTQLRIQIQSYIGPAGPPGIRGLKGPPGLKGDRGPKGPPGECCQNTCHSGPPGPPGPMGVFGDPGPKGECCYGVRGDRGPKGPRGGSQRGPDGAKGSKGEPGARGLWTVAQGAGTPGDYYG